VAVIDPRPVSLPFKFEHLPLAPGNINAALGTVVAKALDGKNLEGLPSEMQQFYQMLPQEYRLEAQTHDLLAGLSKRLAAAQRPVLVCGTDVVRDSTPALAADLLRLLREAGVNAGLFYLLPGAHAFGAARLSPLNAGLTPLVEAIEAGEVKALVVVESDPCWDYPDQERLDRALEKLELLVALDYLPSPTVARADIVLPTLTVFERTPSSFVNQEGRLQLAPPVHLGGSPMAQISPEGHPPRTFLSRVPGGEPRTPGEIFQELAAPMSPPAALPVDDLWDWLGQENPVFANIAALFSPPPGARLLPSAIPPGASSPAESLLPEPPPPEHLELLLVDSIFGTEELASYSQYIQQVEEAPRLLTHPDDAAKLGLEAGDQVALGLPGGELKVALQVAENMAPGVMVLPRHRQLNWRLAPDYQVMVPYRDIVKVEE
jgi:anaerobic selenocysteine-containing dehydrogenase